MIEQQDWSHSHILDKYNKNHSKQTEAVNYAVNGAYLTQMKYQLVPRGIQIIVKNIPETGEGSKLPYGRLHLADTHFKTLYSTQMS